MDTSTIITIAIAVVSALVTIAVSWGIIRTEVSAMKETDIRQQAEIDKLKEQSVTRESCRETHHRTDKGYDELRADIKEIKSMLLSWFKKQSEE